MKLTSIYSFLSKNSFLLPLGIFLLTAITILLTLLPSQFIGQHQVFSYDKLGHMALFGGWTYTLGLYHYINWTSRTNFWAIFFIGVSFGVLIELLQHFLPLNRNGDPVDLLFDALGCLIAVWVLKKTTPKS